MNAPERIWLQDAGDYKLAAKAMSDLTWCSNPIDEDDTEYVRADLFAAEKARADKAEALLAEAVAELEGWSAIYTNCSISTGYCCCGDAMEGHENPMNCGHSPVDHGWYVSSQQIESTRATLAKIKDAKNG